MTHRIRAAMADGQPGPLGGLGKTVEADETYFGNSAQDRRSAFKARGSGVDKWKVVPLVERGGKARSVRVDFLTANRVREVIVTNVDRKSDLMTDESNIYKRLGEEFSSYGVVNHSRKEYARGPISTNTVEGFFSSFKRDTICTYQHCGEQHLHGHVRGNRNRLSVDIARGYLVK